MRYGIVVNGELYHHGIIGQKWGIRRFQNKNGKLTSAGKKRKLLSLNPFRRKSKDKKDEYKLAITDNHKIGFVHDDYTKGHDKRPISQLSNAELKAKIERIALEKKYNELTANNTKTGKSFLKRASSIAKTYVSIADTLEKVDKATKTYGVLMGKTSKKKK